ncbi:hypothetical protein BC829DRAFT_422860 [Chytridium lagenaria]|nr:hypothetical protein BC829DRAFT_422860 [Chytridium lagenaria]
MGLIGADKATQTINKSYINNTINPGVNDAAAAFVLATPNGLDDFVETRANRLYTFALFANTFPLGLKALKALFLAYDALKRLREHYGVNTIEQRQAIIANFSNLTMTDGEPLDSYINRFYQLLSKVQHVVNNPTPTRPQYQDYRTFEAAVHVLYRGLPASIFGHIRNNHRSRTDINTIHKAINALRNAARDINYHGTPMINNPNALIALDDTVRNRGPRGPTNNIPGRGRGGARGAQRPGIRPGHQRHPTKEPLICYQCGGRGHFAGDCATPDTRERVHVTLEDSEGVMDVEHLGDDVDNDDLEEYVDDEEEEDFY